MAAKTHLTSSHKPGRADSFGSVSQAALDEVVLIELLENQRRLYERLAALSLAQEAEILGGHMEAVLGVLGQRQGLIDELGEIHQQLEPYRRCWEAFWSGLSQASRDRAGTLVAQSGELLSAIIERDERHRQRLQESRSQVGGELGKLSAGGVAMQAYAARATAESRFTDRKG